MQPEFTLISRVGFLSIDACSICKSLKNVQTSQKASRINIDYLRISALFSSLPLITENRKNQFALLIKKQRRKSFLIFCQTRAPNKAENKATPRTATLRSIKLRLQQQEQQQSEIATKAGEKPTSTPSYLTQATTLRHRHFDQY